MTDPSQNIAKRLVQEIVKGEKEITAPWRHIHQFQKGSRDIATTRAWKEEVEAVQKTGRGMDYKWTERDLKDLKRGDYQKVRKRGIQGHHINSIDVALSCLSLGFSCG